MGDVAKILTAMRRNPKDVRFADLCKVCEHYFGAPRQKGTSHRTYKTPWPNEPRINIQAHQGRGKPYQVRQVLKAIDRLEQKKRENDEAKE